MNEFRYVIWGTRKPVSAFIDFATQSSDWAFIWTTLDQKEGEARANQELESRKWTAVKMVRKPLTAGMTAGAPPSKFITGYPEVDG
jgi:hypothetical protein